VTAAPFPIVFETNRNFQETASDLWLIDSDGTNERPLTRAPMPEATPSWSPDGATIVYACAPASNWELCTIDPATGKVKQLTKTDEDEFDPRYTSDGKQIVLESYQKGSDTADIASMPAGGGVPERLTKTPGDNEQDPSPDPKSTQIAFASDGNIAILDADKPSKLEFVTRDPSRGDSDPSFSSRGEIAFSSAVDGTHDIVVGGSDIQRQRQVKRLTRGGPTNIEPAWTADGTEILFARALRPRSRRYRIFLMDDDGEGRRALTKGGPYSDTEPAPQPVDGPRLPGPTPRIEAQAATGLLHLAARAAGGDLRLAARAAASCRYGTPGPNKLYGTADRDRICAIGGNDEIHTVGGGQDYADGGSGADACWIDDNFDTCVNAVHH
jgi:Tol biopolymer transport system component